MTMHKCVVQPYERPGATIRFEVPAGLTNPLYTFTWTPDVVTCKVVDGSPSVLFRFKHSFIDGIPSPGGENARISLWQLGGQPPSGNKLQEVVV